MRTAVGQSHPKARLALSPLHDAAFVQEIARPPTDASPWAPARSPRGRADPGGASSAPDQAEWIHVREYSVPLLCPPSRG